MPPPVVKFSPMPSFAALAQAKLVVADGPWRAGHNLDFTGSGFDPALTVRVSLVQGGVAQSLGAVAVRKDGRLTAVLGIPEGMSPGKVELKVCSYASSDQPVGCASQLITLSS
jgi:hypothetical protein